MNIDGIIFDLDGTLWDSCRIVAESWGHTLRTKYGAQRVPTEAEVRSIMGMTVAQIAERLFSEYGECALEVCAARAGADVANLRHNHAAFRANSP